MPSREGATFEVIEPQFPLEVLVHAFGPPALFEDADDLLVAHASCQRRQDELRGLALAFGPLSDEPERLAIGECDAVVVRRLHAHETEARAHLASRPVAPDQAAKRFLRQRRDQLGHRLAPGVDAIEPIEAYDAESGQHADGEVQAERAETVAKVGAVAVGAVSKKDAAGEPLSNSPLDHLQGQLHLGLEYDLVGNASLVAARRILDPARRQIQLEV